jgi:uncharacterized protein (DUF2236 family)
MATAPVTNHRDGPDSPDGPGGSVFPDAAEAAALRTGPSSVAWQFGSDPRLYFGMLYPLLLQVADPVVGAGVRDYSDFARRPWARLIGTLDYVVLLIYGGEQTAEVGRRLRNLHKNFKGKRADGKPYYALEREPYAWVHATLIDAYISGHDHFGRPMTAAQKEAFYQEYKGLGRFVGVRPDDLPDDYPAFRRYFEDYVSSNLVHTTSVDAVLRVVNDPKAPLPMPGVLWRAVRVPARRALELGGLGQAPPELRDRLGIPWTERDERAFQRLGRASRALDPLLPERARVLGPMQLRMRRRAIARGPLGGRGD